MYMNYILWMCFDNGYKVTGLGPVACFLACNECVWMVPGTVDPLVD